MSDLSRAEAIEWCKRNFCDFKEPVFPPPEGWAWAESASALVLVPIFTNSGQSEAITSADLWSGK